MYCSPALNTQKKRRKINGFLLQSVSRRTIWHIETYTSAFYFPPPLCMQAFVGFFVQIYFLVFSVSKFTFCCSFFIFNVYTLETIASAPYYNCAAWEFKKRLDSPLLLLWKTTLAASFFLPDQSSRPVPCPPTLLTSQPTRDPRSEAPRSLSTPCHRTNPSSQWDFSPRSSPKLKTGPVKDTLSCAHTFKVQYPITQKCIREASVKGEKEEIQKNSQTQQKYRKEWNYAPFKSGYWKLDN